MLSILDLLCLLLSSSLWPLLYHAMTLTPEHRFLWYRMLGTSWGLFNSASTEIQWLHDCAIFISVCTSQFFISLPVLGFTEPHSEHVWPSSEPMACDTTTLTHSPVLLPLGYLLNKFQCWPLIPVSLYQQDHCSLSRLQTPASHSESTLKCRLSRSQSSTAYCPMPEHYCLIYSVQH